MEKLYFSNSKKSNLTFVANVGTVCEEVSPPSPCAGFMQYLIVKFYKDSVTITEKDISTCDKSTINYTYTSQWELLPNNNIFISSKPKDFQFHYTAKTEYYLKGNILYGSINGWDNKNKVHKFENKPEPIEN